MFNTQKPPLGSLIVPGHPDTIGLASAWIMNEGGGNLVNNYANRLSGTLTSGVWVPRGIEFDGTNDWINTNLNLSWTATQPFTILSRFYRHTNTNQETIVGKDQTSNLYEYQFGTEQGVASRFAFVYYASAGDSLALSGTPAAFTADTWHEYAVSYNGNQYAYLYENGNVPATVSSVGTLYNRSNNTQIGNGYESYNNPGPFDGVIEFVFIFNKYMTQTKVATFFDDPYAMFRQDEIALFVAYGAGAGVEVSATTEELTLTEQDATVKVDRNVLASYDQLALTQYPATINAETSVSAGVDALTLTEYSATVKVDENVLATTDGLTLTEYAATVNAETVVDAAVDELTLTEYQASISAGINVTASTEALTLTENAAVVNAETSITAGVDELVLTEYAADVSVSEAVEVSANTEALTLTEYPANVNAEVSISAEIDELILTQYSADVKVDRNVLASADNLTLTENTADIKADANISAGVDDLTLTAHPATVDIAAAVEVLAGTDALALTEYSANVNAEVSISAEINALILTQYSADVKIDTNVLAWVDALTLTEYGALVESYGLGEIVCSTITSLTPIRNIESLTTSRQITSLTPIRKIESLC